MQVLAPSVAETQIHLDLTTPQTMPGAPMLPNLGRTTQQMPPSVLGQSKPQIVGATIVEAASATAVEDKDDANEYLFTGANNLACGCSGR